MSRMMKHLRVPKPRKSTEDCSCRSTSKTKTLPRSVEICQEKLKLECPTTSGSSSEYLPTFCRPREQQWCEEQFKVGGIVLYQIQTVVLELATCYRNLDHSWGSSLDFRKTFIPEDVVTFLLISPIGKGGSMNIQLIKFGKSTP